MEYRQLSNSNLKISPVILGTWAFGNDSWWGYQDDKDSFAVLDKAVALGINCIDTAPVYGRGHSEKIVGKFLKEKRLREKIVIATKFGLNWKERSVFHDLKKSRILEEIDLSRKRLDTDYIDLYQLHWPDKETPLGNTADILYSFYQKGVVKAVGVSNLNLEQLKEFKKYSPIHSLQPPYNMFMRDIEKDIVPFCINNEISIISYVPLHSGILTGKFFDGTKIPNDICRKNKKDLKEPLFSINKQILEEIKEIAKKYQATLTQLVINWNFSQPGITSAIVGSRKASQIEENSGSVDFTIEDWDMKKIEDILQKRLTLIEEAKNER